MLLAVVLVAWAPVAARADSVPAVVAGIRAEVTKDGDDPGGRPLPVAAHWQRGNTVGTYTSFVQRDLIAQGRRLLPNLDMVGPSSEVDYSVYEDLVRTYAAWNVPICVRGNNWHLDALRQKQWSDLPPAENALLLTPEGAVDKGRADPLGPIAPWRQGGKWLVSGDAFRSLQKWYPRPPRVIFLSNNETLYMKGGDAVSKSGRFRDAYGTEHSHDFKNHVVGHGYAERFAALIAGMRDGLSAPAWKKNSLFIGYGNFAPEHCGRWGGWKYYSTSGGEVTEKDAAGKDVHFDAEMMQAQLGWDGGSPSYYTHNWSPITDYRVWSPQVESMNWVFVQKRLRKKHPKFWFEISVWDGASGKNSKAAHYRSKGQTWSPDRYGGFVQYGMWLLCPRAVREFRGYMEPIKDHPDYFDAILDAVDGVWDNPTLVEFWRRGELVPNRTQKHPYATDLIPAFNDEDRWFLLDCDANPDPIVWKPDTNVEIPVFSLARVLNEAPNRRWLLYAHSPLGNRQGVKTTVPGFGDATVDVTVPGSFYLLKESDKSVTPVARSRQPSGGANGSTD